MSNESYESIMQRHRPVIGGNFVEPVKGNNVPVCPKPRRLGSALPDFLKNQGFNVDSQVNCDGRSGVHNMVPNKVAETTREATCTGCSSYCYTGSPPGRSGNPLIHDVQFVHQMELFPPLGRT